MKSTYYTGYTDLDESLVKLYGVQSEIEDSRRCGLHSSSNIRIFGEVIREQDELLNQGKERDNEKMGVNP